MNRPSDKSGYILGFTNDFYTLWHYHTSWIPWVEQGRTTHYYPKHSCVYVKNISMDYDSAVDYMQKKYDQHWEEDLALRGEQFSSRDRSLFQDHCPSHLIKFGKYRASEVADIADTDPNYLSWYRSELPNESDHYAFATQELLRVGELVKYKGEVMTNKQMEWKKSDAKLAKMDSGHLFNEGERLELEVKLVKQFGFDTDWGYMVIQTLMTKDKKIVKYKGTSPKDISKDQFIKIKATIKHSIYKDTKDTMLQRITFSK